MHHVLRGALGAALVYPLIRYYSVPEPAMQAAGRSASAQTGARPSGVGSKLADAVDDVGAAEPSRRTRTERLADPVRGGSAEPESPRLPVVEAPRVDNPRVLFPPMPELKETLAQMAELQQHAHDPAELERRVQTLEQDPAKLAKLKALADLFVQLPESRGEAYLPISDGERRSVTTR